MIRAHKRRLRALLEAELRAAGHPDPVTAGVQLVLLIDGTAFTTASRPERTAGRRSPRAGQTRDLPDGPGALALRQGPGTTAPNATALRQKPSAR
ncbi:hypothetical protein GCM10023194_69340 [Planotetraspora phitsanulokensis]|uniref:Uncharacterized protein n=1 Tax=Planotetraspora phitsanulokensis TaxID=575192 RepID=A0A8J3UGX0_9ACTN|nr:hypothetical protein Pph01_80840 [Planotetraspora phitsanulokensis]